MSPEESELLSRIESDLYKQGRQEALTELRTDLQGVGLFGMGTIASIEIAKSAYQMDADAGKFICMYPAVASVVFAALGISAAVSLARDTIAFHEQMDIWKPVE